jgi:hypothetical protein
MHCYKCYKILTVGVTSNKLNNFSLIWFVGKHDCVKDIFVVFLKDMSCVAKIRRKISISDASSAIMKMSFKMIWTSWSSQNLDFLSSHIWKMFKRCYYILILYMHYS